MFGNTEIDDDIIASDDEDWGPQRRRRRTIPDDPSRPRPPRVRRRRASSGDALNGVDARGEGAADTPGEKRMWRRLPDSAVEVLISNLTDCCIEDYVSAEVVFSDVIVRTIFSSTL